MIRKVIERVMAKYEITPESVPEEAEIVNPSIPGNISRSKRFFRTKGFARFEPHSGCTRNWPSAHSWSVLDLKEQKFCHHYGQDCRKCNTKVKPLYEELSVERMAEWACKTHLIRMELREPDHSVDYGDDTEDDSNGPHDQQRCGMCQVLGHACWTKRK